jgi:hypothetical protein
MVKTTLSKLAAARLIVAGATTVVLATGGVALAASTGHLSNPLGDAHRSATGTTHSATTPAGAPSAGDSPAVPPTPAGTPGASPSPSYKGLCQAYQAGATANGGKVLSNPAFAALANEAGGANNVATFCATLIGAPGSHPTGQPTTHPAHPVKPTHPAKPTQAASPTHPAKPTQAATPTHPAHPTHPAQPTALPTQSNPHAG